MSRASAAEPLAAAHWPGAAGFARAWARALTGTSYVPLAGNEIEELLLGLTLRLADALTTTPFKSASGYQVGATLVGNDFATPEALGRTVATVNAELLGALGLADEARRARLDQLLEAVATGYARAMRDRTLDEQESIRRAALSAQANAEAALLSSEVARRHAALHDPLTELPNRTMFTDRLASRFNDAGGAQLGLCVLNLDRFDAVNDSLGQEIGDHLLIEVARRLTELAQDGGYLLARLGADEFGFLIEDPAGADDAPLLAERLLATFAEPIEVDGHHLPLTASIGVVKQPLAGATPTELIRAARISLHWAKVDGKARWVLFDPHRSARDVARYSLSAEMPGALRRGEFTLVYQPVVGLSDDSLRGAEALARWRHPVHGLIEPQRFIDLAEDTGMIVPLGLHLLDQACREAVGWWRSTPQAPFVSVNLAVHQLRHPGLVRDVCAVLADTGLPPERLQLEITESAVISTGDETIHTLHALANLGIRLAIDDFGSGYANLGYLRALPVHALKLDASFVRSLDSPDGDPTGEAILATIVNLGHILGLTVTAEGVETARQADRLRELGCDTGQGWHLGLPVPPGQLIRGRQRT